MRCIFDWLDDNWINLVVLMVLALFCWWMFGYWENGWHGKRFDLASCWAGVVTVTGGAVIGVGRQVLEYKKYRVDSEFNTPAGSAPEQKPSFVKDNK